MKKRIISFDILRIMAIYMIIIYHFNVMYDPIPFGVLYGSFGVILFFLLSGFLLQYSFNRNPSLKNFFKKRFLSIYPATWITFIIFYVFGSIAKNNFFYGGEPFKLIYSFLGIDGYLQIYGVETYFIIGEWFTGAILILYTLFPLLHYLMKNHLGLTTFIITENYLLSLLIVPRILGIGGSPIFCLSVDQRPLVTLFVFYTGMLLECLYEHFRFSYRFLIPSVTGLILFNLFPNLWNFEPGRLFYCVCLFLTILVITQKLELPSKITDAITYLSGLSFVMYLTHHALIYMISDSFKTLSINCNYWVLLVINLLLITALSALILELTKKLITLVSQIPSKIKTPLRKRKETVFRTIYENSLKF